MHRSDRLQAGEESPVTGTGSEELSEAFWPVTSFSCRLSESAASWCPMCKARNGLVQMCSSQP